MHHLEISVLLLASESVRQQFLTRSDEQTPLCFGNSMLVSLFDKKAANNLVF